MNVGEGTGQLPEDWEESYAGEGSDDSNWNREEGNTEEYSAAWAESENDQEESAQWNLDFQTDEVRSQEESFMENVDWMNLFKIRGTGEKAMKFRNRISDKMKIRG